MKLGSWQRITSVIGLVFILGGSLYAREDAPGSRNESLLNHLLAPGPVIRGHAKFEGECLKCHTWGKGLPASKCLDCHDPVKKQIAEKRGFHGLASESCVQCHREHKGRFFDSMAVNEKKFDHSKTSFALKGKHRKAACADCHKEVRGKLSSRPGSLSYFGTNAACASCHQKDDVHFFEGEWAKKDCGSCHGVDDWHKTVNFNHKADTQYQLIGKHAALECASCHVPEDSQNQAGRRVQYRWPDLKVKGCETCHESPHVGTKSFGSFQGKCDECHTSWTWVVSKLLQEFRHDNTRFPLTGNHLRLACRDCHTSAEGHEVYRFPSEAKEFCIDCHLNPHKQQLSAGFAEQKCSLCHSTITFEKQKPFDHNLTRYKLRDTHAQLRCENCHRPTSQQFPVRKKTDALRSMHQFLFPDLTAKACVTCHADVHAGQLGTSCTKCHTETKWQQLKFNHDADSRFPLAGKHAQAKCDKCHGIASDLHASPGRAVKPVVRYRPVASQCVNCHKDPHASRFGSRCGDCHSEEKWRDIKNFHRDFTLTDVHKTLSCNECHKNDRPLKGMSQLCYMCHQKDDIHGGALPTCGDCHKQDFWDHTSFRHSMSFFPLQGVHRTLQCVQCHSNNVYRGTPDQCINCHLAAARGVTNPVHVMPSFTNCKNCHNQFVF